MRNRLASTPGQTSFRNVPLEVPQLQLFASATLNGGMITQIDPVDIQPNQVVLALNATCRYDVLSRRSGHTSFGPAAPNAKRILRLQGFKNFAGSVYFLRFTRDTVHLLTGASWTAITPAVALTATDKSQIHFLSINDRAFFGNESDPLQEINIGAGTCAAAGNAKKYKYYCAFGNRIVGANLAGSSPSGIEVGWSGDFNFTQWDPAVDFSAGFTPLIDNPTDFTDTLTGVFSFTNVMILMRERSIVQATRQPVASNPFYFSTVVPSIGCDTPRSIAQIPTGLAWYDHRLNNVFTYRVGELVPLAIGDTVRKTIGSQVEDNSNIIGSYDSVNDEYMLAISATATTKVRRWKYNFKTQAWVYDEIDNISSINALDFATSSTTINTAVGTIDAAVGFIDDAAPVANQPAIFLGKSDGTIIKDTYLADTDAGTSFTFETRSKLFKLNPNDAYVTELHIEFMAFSVGNFTIEYTIDNGKVFKPYKTVTFDGSKLNQRLTVVCRKNVRARTYQWRITSSAGVFDLLEYSAFAFSSDAFTRQSPTLP